MARPAEKARAMMNKWVKMREEGNSTPSVRGRRPKLASECAHLSDAEYYRTQIVREIANGISKIQNPALGEHTIRDLNDEINRRMREKYHWNRRIKELGGPDYIAIERQQQIEEGDSQSLAGQNYRYFGAAKDLPGVKELLDKQVQKMQAKTRGDVHKYLTPAYFGWRDEEDGVLIEVEEAAFERLKRQKRNDYDGSSIGDGKIQILNLSDDALLSTDYLNVPSQDEIAEQLLEEKKRALLAKFSI
jgi:pre-mRNA-splicing factor ISY1